MINTGFIGGDFGYHVLRYAGRHAVRQPACDGSAYRHRSKIETLLGPGIWEALAGKVVLDFGCGVGIDTIEFARRGARRVIGLDIREDVLEPARRGADTAGVADRCVFTTATDERVDVIVSIDGFEHYADPEQVLRTMRQLVRPDGRVFITFGPPWFHPLGGHLFSVFPWAHLLFTEKALIRWRSDFKSDGATRFCEVAGGLNQMTVRRFRTLVDRCDFAVERFEAAPIKRLRRLSNALTREFVTAMVRCELSPRPAAAERTP
ncbi:MAG: methyltransferase domain-containing protein [Bacillati bacterium ANGP1]|uniref:Methyltransferase domain-containing protein n=1 Tax=Candidatus Segetimicrobium genomatis TaxID=2569760 RepID=A0A537IT76_9BACT|nr:MAG: methyltransferase domain-containing protein [Terrabacteria group bacterium ANGP1]